MSQTLTEIAQQLKDANKKVQLIYAFNGSGKTRLSREFKHQIAPDKEGTEGDEEAAPSRNKILYYSVFTEDLFYWDNDLESDSEPKLKIQPNTFTDWLISLLIELGEYDNIITNFQRYVNDKVTPVFNEEYTYKSKDHTGSEVTITVPAFSEVVFQVAAKPPATLDDVKIKINDEDMVIDGEYERIKISKGEESNFIWSIIYTLLEQIVATLNESDATNRITDKFDQLEYVFIDDPVSSLDDNHLIELAVDLSALIKTTKSQLKFIITTHNPLFYNVLFNELNNKYYKELPSGSTEKIYDPNKHLKKYRLEKKVDGMFGIIEHKTDSPFSYHLFLLSEIQSAIHSGEVRKYHFNFLRNILEKMATFLGYDHWPSLLPKNDNGKPDPFINRIINLSSHSAHAGEEIADIENKDKVKLDNLVKYLIKTYGFRKQEKQYD